MLRISRYADPLTANETLFEAQETLYKAGARNFLIIDVPPMHRSPSGLDSPVVLSTYKRLTHTILLQ